MRKTFYAMIFGVSLTACIGPLAALSPSAKMNEAATNLATNLRFNRMEMAAENVAPSARTKFFDRRKEWGSRIRIADYELTGMKLKEPKAEVTMTVAWFLLDEEELRGTTLKESWKEDAKGDWLLVSEERSDGDLGLFGEPDAPKKKVHEGPPKNAQFPTIHLGSGPITPQREETETPRDQPQPAAAGEIPAQNANAPSDTVPGVAGDPSPASATPPVPASGSDSK